jgi:hypothetical protein
MLRQKIIPNVVVNCLRCVVRLLRLLGSYNNLIFCLSNRKYEWNYCCGMICQQVVSFGKLQISFGVSVPFMQWKKSTPSSICIPYAYKCCAGWIYELIYLFVALSQFLSMNYSGKTSLQLLLIFLGTISTYICRNNKKRERF